MRNKILFILTLIHFHAYALDSARLKCKLWTGPSYYPLKPSVTRDCAPFVLVKRLCSFRESSEIGVACITDVTFSRFLGKRRQSPSERGAPDTRDGKSSFPSCASVMQAKIGDVFHQLWKCYHSTFSRLRGISSESLYSVNNNFMNISYKPISLHLFTMNGEKIVNLSAPSIENILNCYKFELQHSLIRVTQKPYISF